MRKLCLFMGLVLALLSVFTLPALAESPTWERNPAWELPRVVYVITNPALGDLDGDGDPDLLLGHRQGLTDAYRNIGTATSPIWSRYSRWDVESVGMSAAPACGDLDGDGDLDLLIGEQDGNSLAYRNTGSPNDAIWTREPAWDAPDAGAHATPTLADLDGDGDLDLLIGRRDGLIYAYENTGNSTSPAWTRQPAWDIADLGAYAKPFLADLDADGHPDLLIGEYGGRSLAFRNASVGSGPVWERNTTWDLGDVGTYASPALADLDGDGDLDLLEGESAGVTKSYRNTGSATSPVWAGQASWNIAKVEYYSTCPELADLDGDGDLDLLMGLRYGNTDGYENVGDNTHPIWVRQSDWDVGDRGSYVEPALADLDGDGDLDMLLGEYGNYSLNSATCYGYENVGTVSSPSWVYKPSWNLTISGLHAAPALGDFDGDGDQDLVVGEWSGHADFYRNTGTPDNPVWTHDYSWSIYVGNDGKASPVLVDADGDGDLDLMVGTYGCTVVGYQNVGTVTEPAWTRQTSWDSPCISGQRSSPGAGDLDGDGDQDVIIGADTGYSSAYQSLITVRPVAEAGAPQEVNVGAPVTLDGSASSDADGDPLTFHWTIVTRPEGSAAALNDPALVQPTFTPDVPGTYVIELVVHDGTLDSAPDSVTVSTTRPGPTWVRQPAWDIPRPGTEYWAAPELSDLDGDGDLDLLVGRQLGVTRAYENTGSASSVVWSRRADWDMPDLGSYVKPACGDLDGDGDQDLLLGEYGNYSLNNATIYGYDNARDAFSPSWVSEPSWNLGVTSVHAAPGLGDFDGDGDLDLLVGVWSGNVYFYRNVGSADSPIWSRDYSWSIYVGYEGKAEPALGDLDLDGDLDLVVGKSSGTVLVYKNIGNVNSPIWAQQSTWSPAMSLNRNSPTLGDLDGDGDLDMLVGNDNGYVYGYENTNTPPTNQAPIAEAGEGQSVALGDEVVLDGCGSYDPDGDPITYQWTLVIKPADSATTLVGATTANPTFTADKSGEYVLSLVVNDGELNSEPDTVIITTNWLPVADAGEDQLVYMGDTVTLDGSGSYDPDGDPLVTFQWTWISKPTDSTAMLNDPAAIGPIFTADKPGSYTLSLVVYDGQAYSLADTVTITTINRPPVANAGADQAVYVGAGVTLDGSSSHDPDGDLLTYYWTLDSQPDGSMATLDDPTLVAPTLMVDKPGSYTLSLMVYDGQAYSLADSVTITTINRPPVASVGEDQAVYVGNLVTLNGSGSHDPDGDPITYHWTFISKPDGSTATLDDSTAIYPTFTVDKPGTYVLSLVVNDGQLDSDPATATISTLHSRPIADASEDQSVYVGQDVTLDGHTSWDPDGDDLAYYWTFSSKPAGSSATLDDPTAIYPTFTVDKPGDYMLSLVVNDGELDSEPDTVSISTINVASVADAGPDQSVVAGDMVTLDGSGSYDPDGNLLTYQWTLSNKPEGGTAILSDMGVVGPTFIADVPGIYVVTLVVHDGTVYSAPATVTISVVSQVTYVISHLKESIDIVNGFDPAILNNPNNQKALTNKLNAVINKVEQGGYDQAADQLENDILKKTDGCALTGEPDKNDWVLDCDAQAELYAILVEVIAILRQ